MKQQGAGVNLVHVHFFLTSLARVAKSLSMHPNSQDDTALSLSVATGKCVPSTSVSFSAGHIRDGKPCFSSKDWTASLYDMDMIWEHLR
jgi:hypothetical protein